MEEEADMSNPDKTSVPAPVGVHRKHAAMLERFSHRKQSLTSSTKSSSDPFESTHSFLSRFSQSKLSIESDLSRCRQTSSSPATARSDLDRISASISALEKLVAESSYFLPSYEVRTCLQTISNLKQTLETVSSEIVPKKRFSFRNKKISTGNIPEIEPVLESEARPTEFLESIFSARESPGFRDRECEVLSKEFETSEMTEFAISNLNSCEVRLKGCFRALFVHKLKNCRVYSGPVCGSVLIEEVEDCVFMLASHQIRIHHAKSSDFYLRVRSRPIIEDCGEVRFAPYCLSYEGIEKDLGELKLDEDNENWANVDDFKWLKAVQSPNWSILPEIERIGGVTL